MKQDSPRAREPLPPSWQLPLGKQACVLKLLWQSPGVAPKLAALGWRLAQRALPNADRWVGLLEIFDQAFCSSCSGAPKNTSEHTLFECQPANQVWSKVGSWISDKYPQNSNSVTMETTLLGIRGGNKAVPYRKEQRWLILWLCTLFELWKNWSGAVYGGKDASRQEVLLCRIWERWTVAGMVLAWRSPRRFVAQEWQQIGAYDVAEKRWTIQCPWVRPHHGSGSISQQ